MPLRRILLGIAALILAVLAIGVFVISRPGTSGRIVEELRRNGYPLNSTELDAWYRTPPLAENAARAIESALGEIRTTRGTNRGGGGDFTLPARTEVWEPAEIELARSNVVLNADALERIRAGLRLPKSRYSINLVSGVNTLLPQLSQIKAASRLLAAEAAVAAEEGRVTQAVIAITNTLRLGGTLQPEPLLISQLVRLAIDHIALQSAERILTRMALDDALLSSLQEVIAHAEDPGGMRRSLAGEFAIGLPLFTMAPAEAFRYLSLAGAGPPGSPPPATVIAGATLYAGLGLRAHDRRTYLEAFDSMFKAAEKAYPDRLAGTNELDVIIARAAKFPPAIFTRMLIPALSRANQRDAVHCARIRSATVAIAVERYRRAHAGALPATLGALVPTYLAAPPLDPFCGEPLRFKPLAKGFVVYSIGENGRDDDGDGGRDQSRGNRLVDRVPGKDVTFFIER